MPQADESGGRHRWRSPLDRARLPGRHLPEARTMAWLAVMGLAAFLEAPPEFYLAMLTLSPAEPAPGGPVPG